MQSFNNLKYTCKQLALETTKFELEYNELIVAAGQCPKKAEEGGYYKYKERVSAMQRLRELTPQQVAKLEAVFIDAGLDGHLAFEYQPTSPATHMLPHTHPDSIPNVNAWCVAHPRVDVRYKGLHFSYDTIIKSQTTVRAIWQAGIIMFHALRDIDQCEGTAFEEWLLNFAKLAGLDGLRPISDTLVELGARKLWDVGEKGLDEVFGAWAGDEFGGGGGEEDGGGDGEANFVA